jgi:hypothetical protein
MQVSLNEDKKSTATIGGDVIVISNERMVVGTSKVRR